MSTGSLRIGELARELGVTTDTVRFYEKQGWLPRPARAENRYREYGADDLEHLRLLLELRRLDLPLADASRLASWCHSGHCAETTDELPAIVVGQRRMVAERVARLQELDARLERLERHLAVGSVAIRGRRPLSVIEAGGAPCCDAAAAVESTVTGCACCATTGPAGA